MTILCNEPHFVVNIISGARPRCYLASLSLSFSTLPILRIQTGIRRLFDCGILATICALSGQCSCSIPAARSSARVSTNSSISSLMAFRKLAARFSRVNRTSASCPLLQAKQYWTNLFSLSSAVCGFIEDSLWGRKSLLPC